jgi:hypothetical protein
MGHSPFDPVEDGRAWNAGRSGSGLSGSDAYATAPCST